MSNQAFTMEGLDALLDTLNALPEELGQRRVLEKAGKRALVPFITVVKSIAPTDDPTETPRRPAYRLRDSFIISTKLNDNQRKLTRRQGKNFAEVYAGTNDPVGHLIEFGHFVKSRRVRVPGRGGRMKWASGEIVGWAPPQPFVSVAWNVTAGEVLGECAIALAEELDEALTKVVRRT